MGGASVSLAWEKGVRQSRERVEVRGESGDWATPQKAIFGTPPHVLGTFHDLAIAFKTLQKEEPMTRRVLITGGGGALGRSVVSRFLAAGDEVHVPLFDPSEAEALESLSGGGGPALHLHSGVDLTDPGQVTALFETLPPFAVLAHLAGGFAMAPVEETTPEVWQRMLALNATSAFLVARSILPGMRTLGWGRILTVSAIPALRGGASGMSAYSASKAALLNLTETLAREGAPHRITANAVLPSIMDTPGNREAMPKADRSRWIATDDVAELLYFLASEAGGILTGAALPLTRDP
jgi:NAD(P)-dependent dehydrogenase (short-subunit alcohol dehydrogenase family)